MKKSWWLIVGCLLLVALTAGLIVNATVCLTLADLPVHSGDAAPLYGVHAFQTLHPIAVDGGRLFLGGDEYVIFRSQTGRQLVTDGCLGK